MLVVVPAKEALAPGSCVVVAGEASRVVGSVTDRLAERTVAQVCILCGVARVNVYLPDDLAAQARKAGLNLSAVTQEAVRRSLASRSTDAWLATLASPIARVSHERALAALDAARDEAPTRHG
ncbi:type II toxin-antitoxin system CcdA family antitoxin [Acidimicrobium ferrooxidans]|uniref:type II toxin-antitoxin system CcdA family antitoxin n=1 Tax=Acidimicrobium ferrooxidans TaxID=53635 RepID=UPI003CCADC6B